MPTTENMLPIVEISPWLRKFCITVTSLWTRDMMRPVSLLSKNDIERSETRRNMPEAMSYSTYWPTKVM